MGIIKASPRVPFIGEFGGCALVENNGWLMCPEKNVKVSILSLKEHVRSINKQPKGTKFFVGLTISDNKRVHLWREEFTTHIECLSEPTVEFNKKYQKLIKHLNGK